MRPGSRPAVETSRVSDSMLGADTLSSSTSFERVEIPNSLKEGGLDAASTNVEEEAPKPVSVSAVASMFEAKAKEATAPSKIHSLPPSRSASGLSRTAPPRPPPKPASLASRPST
ncbi:hypothetical protein FRC10_009905 [Ceratobasidium sp. 414]|nr:hypothetical protein FRC10_009905 [Ceratobasidium sp. 414]